MRRLIKTTLIVIVLVVVVRVFVIQITAYNKTTMQPNITTNDVLIINKLAYGPRLPMTWFSFPVNSLYIPFTDWHSFIDVIHFPYLRLWGYTTPQRGDIVAYNYPNYYDLNVDLRPIQISRIVALPGDTIAIKKKIVTINHDTLLLPVSLLFHYRVELKSPTDSLPAELTHHLIEKLTATTYDLLMTPQEALALQGKQMAKYIKPIATWKGYESYRCFPKSHYFTWNPDYFGPLAIPKKGDILHLTMKNIALYKRLITDFEHNSLQINDLQENITINGKITDTYRVKENYYFVLDDNRDNAKDSRFWGFLPESHIIGKVSKLF